MREKTWLDSDWLGQVKHMYVMESIFLELFAPSRALGVGCKAMLLADGGVKGCTPNRMRRSVNLRTNRTTGDREHLPVKHNQSPDLLNDRDSQSCLWETHKTFCAGCRTVRYLQSVLAQRHAEGRQ